MKKLIRDYYATMIEEERLSKANGPERLDYLQKKIQEELQEIVDSNFLDPIEYADVIETVYALASYHNICEKTIETVRKAKLEQFGAFEDFLLLEINEGK